MKTDSNSDFQGNEDRGFTRRGFLAGTAAAGLIATVGLATGCSPETPPAASTPNTSGSSVADASIWDKKWSFEIPPDPIDDAQITDTIETEVLVIGAGPSGFATALSAAEAGGKVVLVAKSSTWNALGGSMHAYNTKTLKAMGYEKTPDEISHELRREWLNQANRSDHNKWAKAAFASEKALNWLIDYVEAEGYTTSLEIGPQDADGVHGSGPGSHSFMGGDQMISGGGIQIALGIMEQKFLEFGGQVFYDTTVEQLIRDNNNTGRVSGAIAKDPSGNYIKYVTSKAVVLATGCITMNDDMLARFAPETFNAVKAGAVRLAQNTGDGLQMALWVGAAPQRNWPWACEYNTPLLYFRGETGAMFMGARPYMAFPSMAVNQLGKRYMNEDCSMSLAIPPQIRQPEMLSYSIWTANLADALAPFEMFGRWYGECPYGLLDAETVKANWEAGLGEGGGMTPIENAKFDTLDELASHFSIPVDTLKDTIDNYNSYCAQGFDPEFAKRSKMLVPIDLKGPFYASKSLPTVFCVYGGPRCDIDAHVLDYDDKPIEGLYEVGIMMGDLYQPVYTYLFPGANMGFWNITYGYLTGKGIVEGTI